MTGAISARKLRPEEHSSEEDVLLDKNTNYICKRSKPWYALRKRKPSKFKSDSTVDCKEKAPNGQEDSSKDISEEENRLQGNQENSNPSSKKCWRSRCGRKRKYFGQDSIRQGATKRERNRFNIIQDAFEELRKVIPKEQYPKEGKLSKFATLKLAIAYISLLGNALEAAEKMDDTNHWCALKVQECEDSAQNDKARYTMSRLDDDELFTGDFTDILRAAEENESLDWYEAVMKHGPMEYYANANTFLIR